MGPAGFPIWSSIQTDMEPLGVTGGLTWGRKWDHFPTFLTAAHEVSEEAEEQVSLSETIEHVQSSSEEDLEVLEASAEVAAATRREAEAKERLARARARKSHQNSSRSSISSARFSPARVTAEAAQPAELAQPALSALPALPASLQTGQPVLPVQPDMSAHAQHAQHVTDSRDAQPVRPNWLDWFGTHAPLPSQHVQDGTNAVEPGGSAGVSAGPPGSGGDGQFFAHALHHARKQASDDGRGARTLLDDRDWELHSVQARVRELEALLAQQREGARGTQVSPASFATAATAATACAAPAYIRTEARVHVATEPASYHGSQQEERSLLSGAPPGLPPSAPSTPSSSEDEDDKKKKGGSSPPSSSSSSVGKKKKKKERRRKKAAKQPYKMKTTELKIGQYPTSLTLPAWKRNLLSVVTSSCERPEKAREYLFAAYSADEDGKTFEEMSITDADRHRVIDARLAESLMRIIRGDLSRRVAVLAETAARNRTTLSGRQLLFLILMEFRKDSHLTDAQSYSHLEKLRGVKELKALDSFLSAWDNLMLHFNSPPSRDHLYASFLSKVAEVPELREPLAEQKKLAWSDPKKSYETLRAACDALLDEQRLERHRKQLDHLYESGASQNAIVATPEEKAKMPCFYVRDGRPCPNGKSCAYSHNPAVIEKAKKAKAEKDAKGKGKGKAGKGKDPKGKGKGKVCPFYNSAKGCMHGSQCRYLHEAPAVAAHVAEANNTAEPAPKAKAKAAAAPKAAAAEQKPKA